MSGIIIVMSYRSSYYDRKNAVIKLRTWDKDGKRITVTEKFKPYFYLETTGKEDAMSLYDTALKKYEFENSMERADYLTKYNINRSFGNLPPHQQFLIDKFWDVSHKDEFRKNLMRFAFLDIEVEAKEFPEASEAKFPISLITVYDSKTKKYYVFSHKDVDVSFNKEEDYLSDEDVVIIPFDNERLMLKTFIQMMRVWDFDIIAGWNSDTFDIPYIVHRVRKLLGEAEAEKLSPYNRISERQAETKFGVKISKYVFDGIALIDYLDAYKKFNMNIKESYKLDFIAKEENLGIRKLDYGDKSIYEFQTTEWPRFVKYNVIDVLILVKLEEKLRYIALLTELAYKGLCNVEEGLKTVPLVNGVVSVKAREKGYVIPTFVRPEREGKNIGAYVAPPRKGFVKSLITLDATSLYPSTMISMNLSPETKVGIMRELENGKVEFKKTDGRILVMDKDKFYAVIRENNLILTKYNTVFSQDKKGIIPEILEKFMKERKELKGKMLSYKKQAAEHEDKGDEAEAERCEYLERFYDTQQNAVKVFMNSIYGYMGNKHAPMGDDDVANSITLTCQFLIKNTGAYAYNWICEKSDSKPAYNSVVIYGDTDSIHISPDAVLAKEGWTALTPQGKVDSRMFKLLEDIRTYVNSEVGNWARNELGCLNSKFEFKAEKVCYGGLYNEKKKYCLHTYWEEGVDMDKFKYTGLDVVKSTMPALVKPYAKKFTEEMIVSQDNTVSNASLIKNRDAFMKFTEIEASFVTGIKNVDVWGSKVGPKGPCKGTPWHVKAALTYNKVIKELGIEGKFEPINSGDKVRLFYAKLPNRYNARVVAFKGKYPKEFESIFEMDKETMYEKTMHAYYGRLYSSVGWVLRKHNVQLRADVLSILTKGAANLAEEDTENPLDFEEEDNARSEDDENYDLAE